MSYYYPEMMCIAMLSHKPEMNIPLVLLHQLREMLGSYHVTWVCLWGKERGKGGYALNKSRFYGGWRRGGMVGDGEGMMWLTCQETTNSYECAAKHTTVNFRQAVSVLPICFSVPPSWVVGVCWVTDNIRGPAVRNVTLVSTKPVRLIVNIVINNCTHRR